MIVVERVTNVARGLIQRSGITRSAWLRVAGASVVLMALPFVFRLDGRAHSDWLQFLGRFHPALLHLPIGLIALVPVLEIAGARRAALRDAADFVLRAALALALPTLALGYMLAYGGGEMGTTVSRHMWGAIALCIALMLCVLVRRAWAVGGEGHVYPALLTATVLILVWTGHEGGSITHGSDYLTRYMPGRLRTLFPSSGGVGPDSFYAQHIDTVFEAKCVACHGGGTQKAELRLDSYSYVMRGGKDGVVIVPGKPDASLLLARVTMAPGDQHFMPAEGRTPLTPDEISSIREWIKAGATATSSSGAPHADGHAEDRSEPSSQPVGDYSQLVPEIVRMQHALGAKLVPMSANPSDGLILRTVDVAPSFGDAQLAEFQKFAPYIVEAELGRTRITDASFETLRTFTHLRALHLEGTTITGANLGSLSSLTQLTYLNLSGTKVSAQSVAPLRNMPRLRHLYLFNTLAQPSEETSRSTP